MKYVKTFEQFSFENSTEVVEEGLFSKEKTPEELKEEATEWLKRPNMTKYLMENAVKVYKKSGQKGFGEWAQSFFEGVKKPSLAIEKILEYQKQKFVEFFVKEGGLDLGVGGDKISFDYMTGEYSKTKSDSSTNISFGGGLF